MKIAKKLLRAAFFPVSAINKIIPKSADSVFFYSNLGFRDNVRCMYDYMIDRGMNKKLKITVATDEWRKFAAAAPQNVRFVGLKKGIFSFLRSGLCFYSFGKYPVKPSKKQKVVNLWHGMPLKRIGNTETGCEKTDQNFFTHIIASSPFFADIICRCFNAEKSQVIIAPQPKSDGFYIGEALPGQFAEYDRIIFWLPTFRSSSRLSRSDGMRKGADPFDIDFLRLVCSELEKTKTLLIIKPHPMDDVYIPLHVPKNIAFFGEKELSDINITLYGLLSHTCALITDYSSVYFDYLMLDRPIGFVCPDFEDYKKSRGFVVDNAEELMPGTKISNADELRAFIRETANGEDKFCVQREKLNRLCNSHVGVSACECILKELNFLEES